MMSEQLGTTHDVTTLEIQLIHLVVNGIQLQAKMR